jgi:putative endonuclease
MLHREYHFWVYILSSRSRTLYIGVTNNILNRTATHRESLPGTYTGRYAIHRLVYFEYFQYVRSAIAREKQLKHWTREQKIELIEQGNPTWEDLYPKLQQQIPSGNDRPEKQKPEPGSLRKRQAEQQPQISNAPLASTFKKAPSSRPTAENLTPPHPPGT